MRVFCSKTNSMIWSMIRSSINEFVVISIGINDRWVRLRCLIVLRTWLHDRIRSSMLTVVLRRATLHQFPDTTSILPTAPAVVLMLLK
jgi:hypothetical protein